MRNSEFDVMKGKTVMKSNKLQSSLAVKLILGLMAFTVCLIPLQLVLFILPMNRWIALILKLLLGHAGVIVLFKWLRKHPQDQRPLWFPGLVKGAFFGAILYLVLTAVKFLVFDSALLNLIRVLCPAGLGLLGARTYKNSLNLKEENNNG